MGFCFVIQPFDQGGPFDKRYDGVVEPAIKDADLDPYRVDRDPSVSIPIDQIESGIRNADVCIADITQDNPNVWFELGYAISSRKEVILLCSDKRSTHFPFDVQHRHIIKYKTDSPSDFNNLRKEIANRLKASLKKKETMASLSVGSPIADTEGLGQHEMVALVTVAENMDSLNNRVWIGRIKQDMEAYGFARIAVILALAKLIEKGLVDTEDEFNSYSGETEIMYQATSKGIAWLQNNIDKLNLKTPKPKPDEPDLIPF